VSLFVFAIVSNGQTREANADKKKDAPVVKGV